MKVLRLAPLVLLPLLLAAQPIDLVKELKFGQFKTGSVGALAVADSDPNVIYAGMGEACVRGNATHGDGVYKSVDAGRTWKNVGLQDSYHIGAVRIHPKN